MAFVKQKGKGRLCIYRSVEDGRPTPAGAGGSSLGACGSQASRCSSPCSSASSQVHG